MASNTVALTGGVRTSLASLKSINKNMESTNEKLASGKKINSAMDGANAYFTARSLDSRRESLEGLMDSMQMAANTLSEVDNAVSTLTSYLSLAETACTEALDISNTSSELTALTAFDSTQKLADLSGINTGDSFDIQVGTSSSDKFRVTITATDTISDVANQINGSTEASALGLRASVRSGKLIVKQTDGKAFTVSDVSGNAASALGFGSNEVTGSGILTVGAVGINNGSKLLMTVGTTTKTLEFDSLDEDSDVVNTIINAFGSDKVSASIDSTGALSVTSLDGSAISYREVGQATFEASEASDTLQTHITTADITLGSQINFTVGTESFTYTYDTKQATVADLETDMQAAFDAAVGSGRVTVDLGDGTAGTDITFVTTDGENVTYENVSQQQITSTGDVDNTAIQTLNNKQLTINIAGQGAIAVDFGAEEFAGASTLNDVKASIQAALTTDGTYVAGEDYQINVDGDRLQIVSLGGTATLVAGGAAATILNWGVSAQVDGGNLDNALFGDAAPALTKDATASSNVVDTLNLTSTISAVTGSNLRAANAVLFDDYLNQLDELVSDTSYKGVNLMDGDDLQVYFNESRTTSITIEGKIMDSTGLGLDNSINGWQTNDDVQIALDQVSTAKSTVETYAKKWISNMSVIDLRKSFTEDMSTMLQVGAEDLTLANMEEESASLLSLQTSQSLALNSLTIASQTAQSILRLFQ